MKSSFEIVNSHQEMFGRLTPVFLVLLMSLPEGGVPFPLPWGSWGRPSDPSLVPVVIIPGTGGNQLEARLNRTSVIADYCDKQTDWYRIWLNIWDKIVSGRMECFVDNFKLHYDPETGSSSNQPGVEVRVPGWGDVSSMALIDTSWAAWVFGVAQYLDPVVSTLVSWGYVKGRNLRGAPYDCRYAPHSQGEYFRKLVSLIEETYHINGNKKVALLTHSMGGLFGLYFLNLQPKAWKRFYLDSFISTGTPWDGTAMMHQVFASGTNWGVDVVDPFLLREQQRAQESVGMLFARPGTWSASQTIVRTPQRTYNAFDMEPFLNDVEFGIGLDILDHFNRTEYQQNHPGIRFHCIFSDGVDTPEKFIYQKHFDEAKEKPYKVVYGPGDGTVNLRSLRACRKMARKGRLHMHRVPTATHNGILSDPQYHDILKGILTYTDKTFTD